VPDWAARRALLPPAGPARTLVDDLGRRPDELRPREQRLLRAARSVAGARAVATGEDRLRRRGPFADLVGWPRRCDRCGKRRPQPRARPAVPCPGPDRRACPRWRLRHRRRHDPPGHPAQRGPARGAGPNFGRSARSVGPCGRRVVAGGGPDTRAGGDLAPILPFAGRTAGNAGWRAMAVALTDRALPLSPVERAASLSHALRVAGPGVGSEALADAYRYVAARLRGGTDPAVLTTADWGQAQVDAGNLGQGGVVVASSHRWPPRTNSTGHSRPGSAAQPTARLRLRLNGGQPAGPYRRRGTSPAAGGRETGWRAEAATEFRRSWPIRLPIRTAC